MEICGANNRQKLPCGMRAGWGTTHVGTGRCRLHGGSSTGAPKANANAEKTGEHSDKVLTRVEAFKQACDAAPVDPTTMLHEQARRTAGRLAYMFELLLSTEQRLENLAAEGDGTAFTALAIVEVARKQEPRTDEKSQAVQLVDVELSTKSRSLLDLWFNQHEAITRVENLYGRTADRLKPKGDGPAAGGIGQLLVVNNFMPGVDDGEG